MDSENQPTAVDDQEGRGLQVVPLVFGLAFVALGATAIAVDLDDVDLDATWIWVVAFAALGVGGIIATVNAMMRSARSSDGGAGHDPPGLDD